MSGLGVVKQLCCHSKVQNQAPTIETITAGLSGGNQQKIANGDLLLGDLSGGNQQEVALTKWMARSCNLWIVDGPTGAKVDILLDEMACQGFGILMISSELTEIAHINYFLNLSRRIVTMREGLLTGELSHEQFSREALLHLIA
jgi:ABC-type sugar transport system ATPase subunit